MQAPKLSWQITVADSNINVAIERIGNNGFGTPTQIDIHEESSRKRLIANANLVISMLPASLHVVIAKDCIQLRRNLITASYVSEEIKAMHEDARDAGLLFMNEMGLDPGIDHMSAMKIIHEVERLSGDIYSFKSYCGGLVSPQSDTNPWHYKISWNPRNIVNAGKMGADFKLLGFDKHLNYKELFKEYETMQVPNFGHLAAYANRDSLSYQSLYGLHNVKTMLRATFRYEEFCIGWNAIVQLGLTDEKNMYKCNSLSYYEWFMFASEKIEGNTPEEKIKNCTDKSSEAIELIEWLGLYEKAKIILEVDATSADIIQNLLETKWAMNPNDKDLIVMHHEFEYGRKNFNAKLTSTLIVEGEDKTYTAMAKTVGLPMAIFTKLFLTGKIKSLLGVQIPVMKEVYKPVLKELAENGIEFVENFHV